MIGYHSTGDCWICSFIVLYSSCVHHRSARAGAGPWLLPMVWPACAAARHGTVITYDIDPIHIWCPCPHGIDPINKDSIMSFAAMLSIKFVQLEPSKHCFKWARSQSKVCSNGIDLLSNNRLYIGWHYLSNATCLIRPHGQGTCRYCLHVILHLVILTSDW